MILQYRIPPDMMDGPERVILIDTVNLRVEVTTAVRDCLALVALANVVQRSTPDASSACSPDAFAALLTAAASSARQGSARAPLQLLAS
jgi:hypothetical protein